jgi:hypothetical protein
MDWSLKPCTGTPEGHAKQREEAQLGGPYWRPLVLVAPVHINFNPQPS